MNDKKLDPNSPVGKLFKEAIDRGNKMTPPESEKCTCMRCAGNAIKTTGIKGHFVTVGMHEGTDAFGNPEMQLTIDVHKDDGVYVIDISENQEIGEFKKAMKELFK